MASPPQPPVTDSGWTTFLQKPGMLQMPGPPPSSPLNSGPPPSTPLVSSSLDTAAARLAELRPDFKLDSTELRQLRVFLDQRSRQSDPPKWQDQLQTTLRILAFVSAPALACFLRPSIIHPTRSLFFFPLVVLASTVIAMIYVNIFPMLNALVGLLGLPKPIVTPIGVVLFTGYLLLPIWILPKIVAAPHLATWVAWPLLSSFIAFLLFQAINFINLTWSLIRAGRKRGANARVPEAFIACTLLDLLVEGAFSAANPVPLVKRQSWVKFLSEIAACIEISLAGQIANADPTVAAQIGAELDKRAGAMRELATEIALSGEPGIDVAARVRSLIRSACYLDWQSLPSSDLPARQARIRVRVWLTNAARSLITMVLPLSIEFAIHRGWVVLDPAQKSWLNTILLLWIGFIILSLIDPNYEFTNKTLDTVNRFPLIGKLSKKE